LRALLVASAVGLVMATFVSPARPSIVSPRAGQSVTQTDLLSYLFVAPQPGDWLRYVVSVNGNPIVAKTIGFGSELLHDQPAAYFEIQTQQPALRGVPVSMQHVAGGSLTWKMYVNAADFTDGTRTYAFAGGIVRIGDSYFRLGGNPLSPPEAASSQTLQSLLLFGLLPMPDARSGSVVASEPEARTVDGRELQTVHTTVDFSPNALGTVAGLPGSRVETWQTSDVPLGLVSVRVTENAGVFSMDLLSFGRGSYREQITRGIDTVPYFPGS